MTGIEEFISLKTVGRLYKFLRKIQGERQQVIDDIAGNFGDPEQLAKYYVQPDCQPHNTADLEDEGRANFRKPVFDELNEFLAKEIAQREGNNQMFILSDAGMGKTSLLMMLRLERLQRAWPGGYDCRLFKLGPDTLAEIEAIPAGERSKTILLLDALDEDKAALGRIKERLLELLRATAFFRRVLISCRTQFFPEAELDPFGRPGQVVVGGFTCPMIFLSLFDDGQIEEFLEKKFPRPWYDWFAFDFEVNRQRRKKAGSLVERMGTLRMRPMLLSHAEDLLDADSEKVKTGYGIYDILLDRWLNRERVKIGGAHSDAARQPSREDLKLACVRVAEWMQQRDQRFIPAADLEQLVQETPQIRYLKDFELGGRSLLNRKSDGAYRFGHYTIQEFLLAYGLIERLLRDPGAIRVSDQLSAFVYEEVWLDREDLRSVAAQAYLKGGGPKMLGIPAGRFLMGDSQGKGEDNERPVHEVRVSAFEIGQYPVTFAEYDLFCSLTDREKPPDEGWGRGRRPVINVSWHDAVAFCEWLSEASGEPYRLPTEAEWEYACRAGSKTEYFFGNAEAGLDQYAWYDKNSGGRTHPVGEKAPNPWGLYDMHGNVWEWTADWFGAYSAEPQADPAGPAQGDARVLRGGSWVFSGRLCRSANRNRNTPDYRNDNAGFRLARGRTSTGQ